LTSESDWEDLLKAAQESTMSKIIVHVEYCGAWGYAGKYERLKSAILKAVPEAEITGVVGRKTAFEITLNGKVIYSKLKTGNMPEENDIVEMIKKEAAEAK